MNVEVTLPVSRKGRRARSLSRNNTETLPDENVTISLPGSKRGSRQPSVDRSSETCVGGQLKKSSQSSSMEIFTGIYEMKIPNPVNGLNKNQTNKHASVNEIHTDTIRLKSGEFGGEETSTQVTLKAPAQTLSKHASRESLAICNTTSHKSSMPNEQKSYNSKRDF